jgi:hypothetical protein
MFRFVSSVRQAVTERNWYSALIGALTLPDICGWLESPKLGSQARYVAWCRRFLEPKYTYPLGPTHKHTFLNGEDSYALRCAVLHQGSHDITRQRARAALDRFHFIEPPPPPRVVHCNQVNNTLQLQVDLFCLDIATGVEDWQRDVLAASSDAQARLAELVLIRPVNGSVSVP